MSSIIAFSNASCPSPSSLRSAFRPGGSPKKLLAQRCRGPSIRAQCRRPRRRRDYRRPHRRVPGARHGDHAHPGRRATSGGLGLGTSTCSARSLYREYGGTRWCCSFGGRWLLLTTGGPPTDDKPGVTLAPPRDPATPDHLFTIRVDDCRRCTRRSAARGARSCAARDDRRGDAGILPGPRRAPVRDQRVPGLGLACGRWRGRRATRDPAIHDAGGEPRDRAVRRRAACVGC